MTMLGPTLALIAAAGAALTLIFALLRLFAGPTLYDRVLAANSAASKAALVCAALAVAAGRGAWTDAAFALVLCAFVANVAIVKVFRAGSFQPPLGRVDGLEEGQ